MARIDPISVHYFLAAAREGSIKRAAQREHLAQSALSRRIADLEHALGVALFVRSPLGVRLTEAGERAVALGRRLDDDLHAFAREVSQAGGRVAGTVRLCANTSSIVGFLPERLQRLHARYPALEIELQERDSEEVLRACADDAADVGIATACDPPRILDAWHFANDPMIVVAPRGHAITTLRRVRLADLLAYPLVAIREGGWVDRLLHTHADRARLPIRTSVATGSFEAACRMVEAGLGLSVMTAAAAAGYAGSRRFVRRPLAEPWASRALHVYAPRKSPRPPSVAAVIKTLTR